MAWLPSSESAVGGVPFVERHEEIGTEERAQCAPLTLRVDVKVVEESNKGTVCRSAPYERSERLKRIALGSAFGGR